MSDDLSVPCFNGGEAYVGHGVDLVMVAFTRDVKWWRNSTWLRPIDARKLAAALLCQADSAEAAERSDEPKL